MMIGPWYPVSVRQSRQVDVLPDGGCVFVVPTWDLARHYRQGILIRRGARVADCTRIISAGARDLAARLTGVTVPIIISWEVMALAPKAMVERVDSLVAGANAAPPADRPGEVPRRHRPDWVHDLT